jgi:putative nucleotidyltransferase with HDIG domain
MLIARDTSRLLRDKVLKEIEKDSMVNSFSGAAQKLMDLTQQPEVQMSEIAEVVKTEAGLASRVIKLSNSIVYGGKSIKNIDEALLRIGMEEIKKMAMTVGVMDRVSHMKVKIDWNMYWLHCLLTARVTELLAGVYRETTGKEYLAGLLHDIGKLFLEHHFPDAFEAAVFRSMERGCGMYEAETQLYDITHPEVGSMLCQKWGLHPEIIRSVQFHHEPNSPLNTDPLNPEEERLVATCISVADSLANMCKANIPGAKRYRDASIENLPEWQALQSYPSINPTDIDLPSEIQKVEETVAAIQNHS